MKRKLPVLSIAALAVVGAPGSLLGQESPPARGLVGIYLLFCPTYDTAHCVVKDTTLQLEPKVCNMTSKGFDRATNQAGRVTVKCRR